MITLKQALKTIDIEEGETICVVTEPGGWKNVDGKKKWFNEISTLYTKETLSKRFDYKSVKVFKIEPYFSCGELDGWKLYVSYSHKEIKIPFKYLDYIEKIEEKAGKYKCILTKNCVCKNNGFNFIIADSKKEMFQKLKVKIRTK